MLVSEFCSHTILVSAKIPCCILSALVYASIFPPAPHGISSRLFIHSHHPTIIATFPTLSEKGGGKINESYLLKIVCDGKNLRQSLAMEKETFENP